MECVREDLSFSRQALQTEWPQGRHRGWAMNPSQLLHSSRPGGGGALRGSAVSRLLRRAERSVRDSWLYEDILLSSFLNKMAAFVLMYHGQYCVEGWSASLAAKVLSIAQSRWLLGSPLPRPVTAIDGWLSTESHTTIC